jgi:predicted acetyltransferase
VDVEYRAVTEAEYDNFARTDIIAFGQSAFAPETPFGFARSELDRTRAAFVGDDIVGAGRNYSLELTLPGGAIVPAAGVSWISVLPTHRRRGVLRGMMAALRDDAIAHGETLSMLTASEGSIYRRFGYGVATWRTILHVERAHSAFASPVYDDGRIRYLDRADALARFPEVYAGACKLRPGMVSRPEAWWEETMHHIAPPDKGCFFVIHEDIDGVADGFLTYEIIGDFSVGINRGRLQIVDFITLNPETRAVLWQFAFSVDLVETIGARQIPVDDPLRFLLADPRRMQIDAVNDALWLQVIDVERALEARRYSTTDEVVLEIHDGSTVTRVALDGGPDGAQCKATTSEPDIVLGLAQLGSIYLGGVRLEQLANAGAAEERTPGAIARVDAMFASYPLPASPSFF